MRGASGKPGGAAGGPSPPTAKLLETVAGLKARGVAVLLVEQKVEAALKVADRIVFLENGRSATRRRPAS